MIAQLLKVHLNGYYNHSGGDRDKVEVIDCLTKAEIKDKITAALAEFNIQRQGYILAKYEGKMFMCELNNIDRNKPYVKHEVTFHPHQDKFVV